MDDDEDEFGDYAAYLRATRKYRQAAGDPFFPVGETAAEPEPSPPTELGRWIIGKDPLCDMVLSDRHVHARHCEVAYWSDGTATVRALEGPVTLVRSGIRGKARPWRVAPGDGEERFSFGSTVIVGRTPVPWHRQVKE